MKKYNISNFDNVDYFMSDRVTVSSLEYGAKTYGGATKIFNNIYSNVSKSNYITIKEGFSLNELGLYIPSTLNGNIPINNSAYVDKYYNIIKNSYNDILTIPTQGSWYSEDKHMTITEDVSIIMVYLQKISTNDIQSFINLALRVKEDMTQESVSVSVNNSLILV